MSDVRYKIDTCGNLYFVHNGSVYDTCIDSEDRISIGLIGSSNLIKETIDNIEYKTIETIPKKNNEKTLKSKASDELENVKKNEDGDEDDDGYTENDDIMKYDIMKKYYYEDMEYNEDVEIDDDDVQFNYYEALDDPYFDFSVEKKKLGDMKNIMCEYDDIVASYDIYVYEGDIDNRLLLIKSKIVGTFSVYRILLYPDVNKIMIRQISSDLSHTYKYEIIDDKIVLNEIE